MSHFSKIKTMITDRALLEAALSQTGCTIQPDKQSIAGFRGEETPVDICVTLPKEDYEIGFILSDGKYELTADWWGFHTIDQKAFLDKIVQRYAYLSTLQALEKQGFRVTGEETNQQGEIKLVLRRMV